MYRNDYEYTDENGITRSIETGNEIKFYKDDNVMNSSTETRMIMKIGYSISEDNKVLLQNSDKVLVL